MNPLQPLQPLGGQPSRSQYLAQALQSLQAGAPDISTPAALGTNLLADALLQGANSKQSYDDQMQKAGIDYKSIDPGAGPQSLFQKLGGLFGLGQGS